MSLYKSRLNGVYGEGHSRVAVASHDHADILSDIFQKSE